MLTGKINVAISDDFIVLDSADARVSGILNAAFTKKLYNPSGTEVSGAITVTVAELGNGTYRASYTPNAVGLWELDIVHATYLVGGVANSHQIFTDDIDSVDTAVWAVGTRALTDKIGFSLSNTGADLILKSSTFIQAIVSAINEFATYGLTALNTLLVTTGIKAASIPAATLVDDAITASKFDEITAFPLKSDDSGASKIARTGADADTLETLSDQIDPMAIDITLIKDIENGRWVISANQMIFYKSDNLTEVARFNLKDVSGNPAMTSIFERVKV